MELLTHGGEHHEIGDGGWLMMTTATNPPLRSPERTPDQPSWEVLGLGGGSVSWNAMISSLWFFSPRKPIYGVGVGIGRPPGGPRGRGRAQGGRAHTHPRGGLGTALVHLRCSVRFFWSKNKFLKFQVNWTPFGFPFLRYSKKGKNWH